MVSNKEWVESYEAAKKLYGEEKDMDMKQYAQSESAYLKAKEFVGKNLKVTIAKVEIVHFEANESKPERDLPALRFEGKDKGLVLNSTNTQALCEAYGGDSDQWIGREIGLSVKDYGDKGFPPGWVVKPLGIPEPEFEDDIPF